MKAESGSDITRLLREATKGDREALDALVPRLYGHLRRLAHHRLHAERSGHTLNTTALVHEAYLELVDVDHVLCALPGLARAYDQAGDADSALALYERYVTTPYSRRLYSVDQLFLARSYERLGELHEERADLESAATYYGKLTRLWSGADSELQPRVRLAQRRLEELCRSVDCANLLEPDAPAVGSLRVTVRESGQDLDINGYAVRIDLSEETTPTWILDPFTKKVTGNGSVTIPGIAAGTHTAHLVDLWANCEAEDDVQTFDVSAGRTSELAFEVTCSEEPEATVDVTGTWAGDFTSVIDFDGEITVELEQVGDDVVGSFSMVSQGEEEDPAAGQITGRVAAKALTTATEFGGDPGSNKGRIHFFLDVSEDRMEGDWSWDGFMTFGTMVLIRQ